MTGVQTCALPIYYLKSRYPEVRLIQCLPTSNNGLKEDFLIFSRGWHDGLPCPTKEGKPGGGLTVNLYALVCVPLSFPLSTFLTKFFFFSYFNNFTNNRFTKLAQLSEQSEPRQSLTI